MKSLHDLIYGYDDEEQLQQQQQEEEEPQQQPHEEQQQQQEPPKKKDAKKASRKRAHADITTSNNNETTEDSNNTAAVPSIVQRMDVLFNPSTANDEDPLQASLNPPVVKKAPRQETTMTEERRAKLERTSEWLHMRQQWKRRRVNFREETDVGDVLQQVFLQNTSVPPAETEPIVPSPEHPTELVDTSDEEEEAILRQLTQSSGQEEKRKKRKLQEEQEEREKNDIFIPYEEKMNFHDRGFVQPDDLDPLRQYYEQRKQAVVQKSVKVTQPYPKLSGEAITLRPIPVTHRLKLQESTFPPLDHNLYCSPQFVHKRQVLRLAARFLLASGRHRDAHTTTRFLQCLWNSDMLEGSNTILIRNVAKETANRYHLFWSHLWKNRSEVAELLGISKELQVAGPHVGYRLDVAGFDYKQTEIMKLRKTQSRGAISAGGPQKKYSGVRKTVATKAEVDLRAVVSYAFTPGTIPPVPRHPLDESGVILGPPDKFSNYITGRVMIEESTITLTSAHLLAIFAANIKSNTSTEDICLQIQSMFRKAIDLNKKIARFATLASAEDDWPLPHVYKSWMGYYSLVINGLLGFAEDSSPAHADTTIKEGQTTVDSYLDDVSTSFSSVKEVAAEFYEIYQQVDQTIGLERFGDYHVVNGLFRIAKDLPESVARLMLQPLNEEGDRMPFKWMHSILIHLERNGMLTEKSSSTNSVSVIELEYAMYQASQIFFKCIERDPTELNFHCWHLAALGCSLLLCAGNRIDSGAFFQPSSGQELSRQPLPKFEETRRDTARALYLLFQLASKQRNQTHVALSSDVHLAVTSFLEWHEVVALLLGSPCSHEKTHALKSIHKHHLALWAYSCFDACQGLSRQADDYSVRIEAAARSLEQDPSCKKNWRILAFELGAVGCRPTAAELKTKRFCVKKECPQCSLLISDRYIDHIYLERADESSKHWWGRNRKGWWHSCVLGLKIPTRYDFSSLNSALWQSRLPFYRTFRSTLGSLEQPVPRGIDEGADASDLDKLYELLTDVDSQHTEQDSVDSGRVGDHLPQFFSETLSQSGDRTDEETLFNEFANAIDDDVLEVECYRILIASHLHGPRHPWILSKVAHLATSAWDRKTLSIKQDSVEWTAVKWLYQMGINSTNVVKLASKLHDKKPRRKNY
ncbi:hypothetical protein FisN_38Hh016 [Fistulifera solaris]|uniref:Uncharacterized protein n=1 Tax=Fistulifera solaris TaxID=1519565 RepID=A0A1Z5KQA2_FISSO|nr:hypothetical protein FisN_38Hh016 [Fistulifera solaris]|eukprot:GAX28490.1 hypothetical protein FisN_38Hh016 [Fistulifera solaris]